MKKLFLFLVLLFAVASWASCEFGDYSLMTGQGRVYCNYGNCGGQTCSDVLSDCTMDGCPATQEYRGYFYSGLKKSSDAKCNNNVSYCTSAGTYPSCWYGVRCSSSCESDSLICVNAGNIWQYTGGATCGGMECVEPSPCDTTMHCIEYPFNRCEEVPSSGDVYCDENGCTGLPYTRWFSEYRRECHNECGSYDVQSIFGDTLVSFDSDCTDTTQCSEQTFCVDFPNQGTYATYKTCIVGNQQIGNNVSNRAYPQFIGGGSGSCASVGLSSKNFPNSNGNGNNTGFPNTNDNNNITDNCLIYGIDCEPNFIDTLDYNQHDNRNPSHCICEPLDGSTFVSSIICPDGSRSTFYGSCETWNLANQSSSSNPPESSSSGSENPPTSSGGNSSGISGEYPDFPEYRKNQRDANEVLGSIAQSLKSLPTSIVNGLKNFINGYTYNEVDGQLNWNRVDSVITLDTLIDTSGVLNAIFGRIDSTNRILDTLPYSSFTSCPCITFFNGNQQMDLRAGHLAFKEIKIELANLHGFNFCRIVSTIVVAFASVVSFFIGFAIFKNISP